MKNFLLFYKNLSPEFKKTTSIIFISYFLILFSYPLMRSVSSALFYDVYTVKEYSLATFIGIIALMFMIGINNKLLGRIGVHKLFILTSSLTIVSLLGAYLGFKSEIKEMALVIFAVKEAYIVLLLHSCLAFTNSYFDLEQLKRLLGPIGGAGALGGIVGGQLTKYMANSYGTEAVFYGSLVIIFAAMVVFNLSSHIKLKGLSSNKSITPLKAIRGVKKYVFLIASVVALSQLVIYIAELQFNILFEQMVTTKNERTAYLGQFYSYVNGVSLVLQFFVLPYLLLRFSNRSIFLAIPILYIIVVICGVSTGVSSLFITAAVFITFKGVDYSAFAIAKEVMYNPLLSLQKFGAKYLTDMFVYRLAKALIAFVFALEFIKNRYITMNVLTSLQFIFLGIWIFLVFTLFREQKKINK